MLDGYHTGCQNKRQAIADVNLSRKSCEIGIGSMAFARYWYRRWNITFQSWHWIKTIEYDTVFLSSKSSNSMIKENMFVIFFRTIRSEFIHKIESGKSTAIVIITKIVASNLYLTISDDKHPNLVCMHRNNTIPRHTKYIAIFLQKQEVMSHPSGLAPSVGYLTSESNERNLGWQARPKTSNI